MSQSTLIVENRNKEYLKDLVLCFLFTSIIGTGALIVVNIFGTELVSVNLFVSDFLPIYLIGFPLWIITISFRSARSGRESDHIQEVKPSKYPRLGREFIRFLRWVQLTTIIILLIGFLAWINNSPATVEKMTGLMQFIIYGSFSLYLFDALIRLILSELRTPGDPKN